MTDTLVPLGMFAMVAFIVWVKAEGARRRQLLATEFHAKLLERMSSAREFGALFIRRLRRHSGNMCIELLATPPTPTTSSRRRSCACCDRHRRTKKRGVRISIA